MRFYHKENLGDYYMEVIENKVNKALLALAIGTTVMGASVTVQAEEVSVPTTNQTEVTPSETVTAETVATAKTNLDEANQNASKQTEVVAQAQTEVNAASETVTNAEEAVSEAQAIKDQATVVTEAKEKIATATAEQTEKVTAVESQEAVVEEKQEVVNDAQQAVDSSQKSVDNAQAGLDGTGHETNAEAERAGVALAESEAEVSIREGELAVAKESDRNAQILLDGLEYFIRNDKVTVNTTKTALDQASAKVSETTETVKTETADVTTAKEQVEGLEAEINNKNTISDKLAQAQTNLDKETAELRLATTANNEAKALEYSAKQDYDMAVAELNREQSELTRLQNRVAKTPQAITNYANAVAKRDTDKAINDKAQEALATLNADVKTKQEALANAKADLVEKQNQLAIAKADLSKEQSVLENLASSLREAEATVKEKEAVLAQAEVKAEDLKNAPKVLAEAQAKLAEAEKVLAEKLNILEDEQAKLKTLEAVQAEARKVAMEEKRQEIGNSGQTAIPVVDENGQIVDYVAETPKSSIDSNNQGPTTHIAKYVQATLNQMVTHAETLKVVASHQTQNTYEALLPNTGDASTATFTLMGMSCLALGVVGIRKRRLV